MKHYGEYLAFKGRAVEWASNDIAMRMTKKHRLEKELENLKSEIAKMEMEFADLIREEWTIGYISTDKLYKVCNDRDNIRNT